MSSLKKIADRISSVTATRQLTASMKMVAVSRLKKKHATFLRSVPYADESNRVVRRLVRAVLEQGNPYALPPLLQDNPMAQKYWVLTITSDNGLSGASQIQVAQQTKKIVDYLIEQGKEVRLMSYGLRGLPLLKRFYPDMNISAFRQKKTTAETVPALAEQFSSEIMRAFEHGAFDVCLIVYNQFNSLVSQHPTIDQFIPAKMFLKENPWAFLIGDTAQIKQKVKPSSFLKAIGGAEVLPSLRNIIFKTDLASGKRSPYLYDYEPSTVPLLQDMLPSYLSAYIYRVLLESEISDNAARLMAMDNATRNAGEMLDNLNKVYRRNRQTKITTDIAEVSGIGKD